MIPYEFKKVYQHVSLYETQHGGKKGSLAYQHMAVYFDDPTNLVDVKGFRACIGLLLKDKVLYSSDSIVEFMKKYDYKSIDLASQNTLYGSFNIKTFYSYTLGRMKFYPAMMDYIAANKLNKEDLIASTGFKASFEIKHGNTMGYYLPIERLEEFSKLTSYPAP